MTTLLLCLCAFLFALGCSLLLHRRDATAMAGRALNPYIDGLPAGVTAFGYALLLAVTGRPILAGLCMAGGSGLLFVLNRLKQHYFHEPIVLFDFTLIDQVGRYPRFYVPYLLPPPVLAGLVVVGAGLVAAWRLEPPVGGTARWLGGLGALILAGVGVGLATLFFPARRPAALALLDRYAPTCTADRDFVRFGLLASFFFHGLWHVQARARDGRPGIAHVSQNAGQAPDLAQPAPHIILVQAESFFDIRRHRPDAPTDVLTHYDRLRREGGGGLFLVPTHGAYTMRTEFAALTGLSPAELGTDALHPYVTAARQPVRSLARDLAAAGYDTRCVHPFYPNFFERDRVMPNLGFRRFESLRDFDGAKRCGPYVSDAALGQRILDRLSASRGPLFVFAISMEAHGPWTRDRFQDDPDAPDSDDPFHLYLAHLRHMDALFGQLAAGVAGLSRPVILAGYGDHVACLPGVGGPDIVHPTASNWFVWNSRGLPGPHRDILPEQLAGVLRDAMAPAPLQEKKK